MNQNQGTVTAMFITQVLLPIIVATAIFIPIAAALSKGMLWGVKEEG